MSILLDFFPDLFGRQLKRESLGCSLISSRGALVMFLLGNLAMRNAVLYDISEHTPIPYLLAFVILYLIIIVIAIRKAERGRLFSLLSGSQGLGWMIVLSGGLLATLVISSQILIAAVYLHTLSTGEYQIVEGPVEQFDPRPIHGHGVASFQVNGVTFTYVASDITIALQQPQPPLQPLHNGQYVRIAYMRDYSVVNFAETVNYRLQILKLEERNVQSSRA